MMANGKKWFGILVFLLMLTLFSFIAASFFSLFIEDTTVIGSGNVAVIPIEGIIMLGDDSQYLGSSVANSERIIEIIKKADENKDIKSIVLDINSPGGTAVASQDIANAIKKTNKTTYAFIHEQGTSGAFWVATAADKLIANELALTGSIGVISSYLEFSGLMQDYNVTYQRLIAGKYKDIGSPYKKLTPEEESLLQKRLNAIHDKFISAVAENRKLPKEKVKEFATGMFYLGGEAKDMGLVDEVGDMDKVTEMLKAELKIDDVRYVRYEQKKTILDILNKLTSNFGFGVGRGITTPNTLNNWAYTIN